MRIAAKLMSWLEPLTGLATYRIRHGLARGLKRRGGFGFLAPTVPLSGEEQFLSRLDLKGFTVYDVGGFEGLYTLFFARGTGPTGRVVCFEPIAASRQRIVENVRINGFSSTVHIEPVAIGARNGTVSFLIPKGGRGSASGSSDLQEGLKNVPAVLQSIQVPVRSLDDYLDKLPPPNLIKIDVEGMELDVIKGARETLGRYHPALFIETHGSSRAAAISLTNALIAELEALTYTCLHAETGRPIRVGSVPDAGSVHLYCTVIPA